MTGKSLLDSLYDLKHVNAWGMFGVLLLWVVFFRFTHYFFFYLDVKPYLVKRKKAANNAPALKKTSSGVA